MATHRSEFYLFVACARNTYHQTLCACIDFLWGFLHIFGVCIKIWLDHKTSFENLCTFLRELIYENNSFRQTNGRTIRQTHGCIWSILHILRWEKHEKCSTNIQPMQTRHYNSSNFEAHTGRRCPVHGHKQHAPPANNNNNNHLVQWQ